MSNGREWKSYPWKKGEQQHVERYLIESFHHTKIRITLASLLRDTDLLRPPTPEWYKLHLIVADEEKWNAGLLSWGLNITAKDFVVMQRNITAVEAVKHSSRYLGLSKETPGKHDSVYERIEGEYRVAAPRFPDAICPEDLWYKRAMMEISTRCEMAAKQMLLIGHYEQETGQITEKGHELWEQRLTRAVETNFPTSNMTSKTRTASSTIGSCGNKRQKTYNLVSGKQLRGRKANAPASTIQHRGPVSGMSSPVRASQDLVASADNGKGQSLHSEEQSSSSSLCKSSDIIRQSQVDTAPDAAFSIRVGFDSDNPSFENMNAWIEYFQNALLSKKNQHPCLELYEWTRERCGWGTFNIIGKSAAQRHETLAALKALLRNAGFRESRNYWGGIRFDPATTQPPMPKN